MTEVTNANPKQNSAIFIGIMCGFPGGSVVKNLPANAGDIGLILGQKEPLGEEMVAHSTILSWRSPGTAESSGLQSMGL